MLPCRENEERVENCSDAFWLSCEIGWEQWGGWGEPEQSTFILALQQMLAAFSFLMSTLGAQLQGKLSKSLKLIDTSGMRNWNIMSLMLLKNIAKLYVAFGGGTRKIQMHYRSVGQKWGDSLQPFPLMCVSDWLKHYEIMSSALVLMIKYCPASQVGSTFICSRTVLLLTVCVFLDKITKCFLLCTYSCLLQCSLKASKLRVSNLVQKLVSAETGSSDPWSKETLLTSSCHSGDVSSVCTQAVDGHLSVMPISWTLKPHPLLPHLHL